MTTNETVERDSLKSDSFDCEKPKKEIDCKEKSQIDCKKKKRQIYCMKQKKQIDCKKRKSQIDCEKQKSQTCQSQKAVLVNTVLKKVQPTLSEREWIIDQRYQDPCTKLKLKGNFYSFCILIINFIHFIILKRNIYPLCSFL